MKTIHMKTGAEVREGDTVTDFRGETATFCSASRAESPGKSGKVIVKLPDGERREYYDRVYDLRVVTEER